MTKPDEKRTGSTSITSALRVVTDLAIPDSIASLTDEQWAERDAQVAAATAKRIEADEDERARSRTRDLQAAGFPVRALEESLRADRTRPAISRVLSWACDERNVLVISGDKGCGKTVASTWWARRQAFTPRFVRATTFAASSRYDREDPRGRQAILSAPGLVLDDLGTEFLDEKGSFLVDLDELIDVYYADRRPLIVTTNLKLEQFRERYGARIEDRMRESAVFYSVSGGTLRGRST